MKTFVGAIIENPKYGFLLQKRDNNPEIPYPGLWTLFGGQVEEGETPAQGLFRELSEELDFSRESVVDYKPFFDGINKDGDRQVIYHIKTTAEIKDLVLKEGEAFGFFPREDVFNREFAFNIGRVLNLFFATN